uniref:Uncharacterized protein n=1 Tax=Quercus lobata TaxID=97700 RepID=A0A7N2MEG3_QUELO
MSVTLHTNLGDIKCEIFCDEVPKTAEESGLRQGLSASASPSFAPWCPPPLSSYSLPSTSSVLVPSLFPLLLIFFLFVPSLFFSSFFTHVLHLPPSSPPSSSLISSLLFPSPSILLPSPSSFSEEGSCHDMSNVEAETEETLKMSFRRSLTVYFSVLRVLSLLQQFSFCIGLFEPFFQVMFETRVGEEKLSPPQGRHVLLKLRRVIYGQRRHRFKEIFPYDRGERMFPTLLVKIRSRFFCCLSFGHVKALRMKRGLEAVANLSSVLPASSPLRREAQVGLLCCRSYGHAKAWGKGQGLEAVAHVSSVLPPRPSLASL